MEKKNKEKLITKIEELVKIVKDSDDYKRFIYLKEQLKDNKDLMKLINNVKKKEQERVNKEYRKEPIKDLDKEIESLKEELNTYPDYLEYSYLQNDINDTLQNIKSIIEDTLNK